MDFEKAYNNLLQDIEIAIEGATNKDTITVLENIKSRNAESEDERIRKWIVAEIEGQYLVDGKNLYCEEAKEALAWREKQKGQKPTEWSREDYERYNSCLLMLSTSLEKRATINSKWFREHVYPKPYWKPTDKQMYCLARASNRCVSIDDAKTLTKLYEELEKFRP